MGMVEFDELKNKQAAADSTFLNMGITFNHYKDDQEIEKIFRPLRDNKGTKQF